MSADLSALSNEELLAEQVTAAAERHRLDARLAAIAAELARRSDPSLGLSGLAQRLGARSPERLLQTAAGLSAREAGALVRVGRLVASAPDPVGGSAQGLAPVAAAIASGSLSLASADAILTGLGAPGEAVSPAALGEAATRLVDAAAQLTPEQLAAEARFLRSELEEESVPDREQARREQRFLRLTPLLDGMTRLAGLLDPESAAVVRNAFDAATSPRRGGPRFVDPEQAARAREIADDPRSTDQLALDAFVALLRIGAEADPSRVLGAGRHAVRVLVTDSDLARRQGAGQLEGQADAVSIATVERYVCDAGTVPIHFDSEGQVVNVGREQRLFTPRQRIGLAARDGGCRWAGCDRPPSWTEAHHINHWTRDGGRTDIADGILLCTHHHHLAHDNGWEIVRDGGAYSLIPPPEVDPGRNPIPLPAKSLAARRLVS